MDGSRPLRVAWFRLGVGTIQRRPSISLETYHLQIRVSVSTISHSKFQVRRFFVSLGNIRLSVETLGSDSRTMTMPNSSSE